MTNLELMEKATSFTTGAYMNAYYKDVESGKIDYSNLERQAINYSATALQKVLYASDGMCKDYTRQDNLRSDMAQLGGDAIKNELLKNIVNVGTYQILNDTGAANVRGDVVREGLSDDAVSVIVLRHIMDYGVEKGYEMLSDPLTLACACRNFAYYRREGKKEVLDNIAKTNEGAMYINNKLDAYYAKYGDSPKSNADNPSFGGK